MTQGLSHANGFVRQPPFGAPFTGSTHFRSFGNWKPAFGYFRDSVPASPSG